MLLKLNFLVVFVLLSTFVFSQSILKGKYHSKSGMSGFNFDFSKDGKFNESHYTCLSYNEYSGTYQLLNDSLTLIYNLDSYFEKKINLKMVTHFEGNNSLKVVLKINIDTLMHNYDGINFLVLDDKDTLAYRKLKSKDTDSFTVSLSSKISYRINFNYKSRANENDSLSNFKFKLDYIADTQTRTNYPIYEVFHLKFHSKRKLVLQYLNSKNELMEFEMIK